MENGYDTSIFSQAPLIGRNGGGQVSLEHGPVFVLAGPPGAFLRAAWDFGQRAVTRYDTTPT